jgi:hypothetical protein
MADCGFVWSLISSDGACAGFDDVSLLYCCVDSLPCRDFVHCLKFDFVDGLVVLVWRCPRFRRLAVGKR